MKIETILSPAELPALAQRDLRATACVVFDVLRATSTFVTALHHGAKAIIPVSEIAEALEIKKAESGKQKAETILLGGERNGVRISANGIDFDLGNSPREYTPEKVRGKTIISTTTNGTRALRACVGATTILASSFLNLTATAEFLWQNNFQNILLGSCAGTGENPADEDVAAGRRAAGTSCQTANDTHSNKTGNSLAARAERFVSRIFTVAKSNLEKTICPFMKTRGGCWQFPNCARTWRSVRSAIFFRWLPEWRQMAAIRQIFLRVVGDFRQ